MLLPWLMPTNCSNFATQSIPQIQQQWLGRSER
jgi:hypothetical protein